MSLHIWRKAAFSKSAKGCVALLAARVPSLHAPIASAPPNTKAIHLDPLDRVGRLNVNLNLLARQRLDLDLQVEVAAVAVINI
eukprot:10210-Chlamydomonas_euryale.AAC.1